MITSPLMRFVGVLRTWYRSKASRNKKKSKVGFPDYIEKAETGVIGKALAMCRYGTLQAPEFDEQDRLADAPVEKAKTVN
jgi:hypothetical protein